MHIHEFLGQVEKLNTGGDPCDYGCSMTNVDAAIAHAKKRFPQLPYCVVSDWVWIDIDAPEEALEKCREKGIYLQYVYAKTIIYDESNRGWEMVRTSDLKLFENNCVFFTRNTAYILVGPGTRTLMAPQVFNSIYF